MNVLLVTGGRNYSDEEKVSRTLDEYPAGSLVIQGGAGGADTIAREHARKSGKFSATIPYAGWLGGQGGPARNVVMVAIAAAMDYDEHDVEVLAFGGNRGTDHCVRTARSHGLIVREFDREDKP